MSNSVNILRNMVSFDKAEQFDGFSKVVIIVSDEIEYSAGTDTGRTLTLNCPWGTQEIADNILQSIKGFQYQPMTANGALIDPSVEVGDGISANGVYSGVYSLETKFNSNLPTTVSAPADEELYEEHTYVPKSEREVTRKFLEFQSQFRIQDGKISAEVSAREEAVNEINAQLAIQADHIAAKVSQTGGNPASFAWEMYADYMRFLARNKETLRLDDSGATLTGIIKATGGKIGGFDIMSNYLTYNNQKWGGTNTTGLYLGINGFQMGKNCKIDMQGNAYFTSANIRGTLRAGDLIYGGDAGYLSGSGLESHTVAGNRLQYNTVSTSYTSGGINTSLGYADFANGVFNGWNKASNIYASTITASGSLYVPAFGSTRRVSVRTVTIAGNVYNILTV